MENNDLKQYYNRYIKTHEMYPAFEDLHEEQKKDLGNTIAFASYKLEKRWNEFKQSIKDKFNRKSRKHHVEIIICPECGADQEAIVLHTFPWPTYIHECNKCEYIIMESDWRIKE